MNLFFSLFPDFDLAMTVFLDIPLALDPHLAFGACADHLYFAFAFMPTAG
jgi:hypothetical protein